MARSAWIAVTAETSEKKVGLKLILTGLSQRNFLGSEKVERRTFYDIAATHYSKTTFSQMPWLFS